MHEKNDFIIDYDKNYSKVMGMINSGLSYDHIASALKIPRFKVVEIDQRAYARSLMFREKREKQERNNNYRRGTQA